MIGLTSCFYVTVLWYFLLLMEHDWPGKHRATIRLHLYHTQSHPAFLCWWLWCLTSHTGETVTSRGGILPACHRYTKVTKCKAPVDFPFSSLTSLFGG